MAHTLSAKKRIRQNVRSRARNRWRKDQIKQAVKSFDEALEAGDTAKAEDALNNCYKTLDHIAAKGTIHKNTASRRKARLTKRLNAAKV